MVSPTVSTKSTQECIPVGCVPTARWPYAWLCFRGRVGVGVYPQRKQKSKKNSPPKIGDPPYPPTPPTPPTPQKIGDPPKIGDPKKIGDPPGPDPPENLETPLGPDPPGAELQGMLGYPPWDWPARHAGIPPLWTDTRLWKYYLGPTSLRPVKTVSLIT